MHKIIRYFIIIFIFYFPEFTVSSDQICIPSCFLKQNEGLKFPDNVYICIDPGHGARRTRPSAGCSNKDYKNKPPQSDTQNETELPERDVVLARISHKNRGASVVDL